MQCRAPAVCWWCRVGRGREDERRGKERGSEERREDLFYLHLVHVPLRKMHSEDTTSKSLTFCVISFDVSKMFNFIKVFLGERGEKEKKRKSPSFRFSLN